MNFNAQHRPDSVKCSGCTRREKIPAVSDNMTYIVSRLPNICLLCTFGFVRVLEITGFDMSNVQRIGNYLNNFLHAMNTPLSSTTKSVIKRGGGEYIF